MVHEMIIQPRPVPRAATISARLTWSERALLHAAAAQYDLTISDLVRQWVVRAARAAIAERGEEVAPTARG